MRPARRADPPHRPDHSKKPRSPLQSPSPDRLPDPSAGAQSFTHSDTDISLPPIASYPTPQLGSKMTKARTAACPPPGVAFNTVNPYFFPRVKSSFRGSGWPEMRYSPFLFRSTSYTMRSPTSGHFNFRSTAPVGGGSEAVLLESALAPNTITRYLACCSRPKGMKKARALSWGGVRPS